MKALLVEDDEFKKNAIRQEISQLGLDIIFEVEKSVQGAIESIKNHEHFDLILLDMALPSHNLIRGKGAPVSMLSGGMEVIMELGYMNRKDKIIVLTQYPEIEIDQTLYSLTEAQEIIETEYEVSLLGIIRFKRETDDWKKSLIEKIKGNYK